MATVPDEGGGLLSNVKKRGSLARKARARDGYATISKGDAKGLRAKFEQIALQENSPPPARGGGPSSSPPSSPSTSVRNGVAAAATPVYDDKTKLHELCTILEKQPAGGASLVEVDQALNVILFHLQSVIVVPDEAHAAGNDTDVDVDNENDSANDVQVLVHDDDAWKLQSVEGALQVYAFLGLREGSPAPAEADAEAEPSPHLLLALHERERLTRERLDRTVACLQALQQSIAVTIGELPYLAMQLGKTREEAPASSPSLRFPAAAAEMKGRRRTMEDYLMIWGNFRGRAEEDYFSLFDGHGGSDASLFACQNLHFLIWKHMNRQRIRDGVDPADDRDKLKKIVTDAFLETHDLMRRNKEINGKKIKGGTTVVTALVIGSTLCVAHVGDSRAVLYVIEESEETWRRRTATSGEAQRDSLVIGRRSAESLSFVREEDEAKGAGEATSEASAAAWANTAQPAAVRKVVQVRTMGLTTDHKPNDPVEKKRIEELGGLVIHSKMDGVPRLNGKIAVSRSLGDLHDPNVDGYLSQEPDFNFIDLAELSQPSESKTVRSLVLVLACDGLWDKLSNEAVGDIVKTQMCAEADLYHIAETLMKTAYDDGSTDNISVLLVDLSSFCDTSTSS